ncbi:MAG TPA: hypothetical protein VMU06_04640 [Stellaceae bacterium]|nr:hypothetical protein [Stellaceae bacterium]
MTAVARRPLPLALRLWLFIAALAIVAFLPAIWMQVALDCDPAWRSDVRPEAAFRVDICRVPTLMDFPGQASDAPGYAVLRDDEGWIAGIVHLGMVGAIDRPAEWTDTGVALMLAAQFELPSRGRLLAARVAIDGLWRFRALLGRVPDDSEFR